MSSRDPKSSMVGWNGDLQLADRGESLPYLKYHHISHPALGVENMI